MAEPESPKSPPLGVGGWLVLIALIGFLGASVWYAAWAWGQMEGVTMSTAGWVFLVSGIVVTFLVGAGLMALVFYSSRKNFDR